MYNKAILIGRLTASPELKRTQSGVSVTSFTLAVDRRYISGGERKADFINCVAWRQAAEFVCKYFAKGEPMGLDGNIQTRNYEDKNGNKRTAVEVVAENVFFVGGKKSDSKEPDEPEISMPTNGNDDFQEVEPEGDLPF